MLGHVNDTKTPEPVIRARGLRKAYRGRPAVDGIDLDVRRGEVFALLGPNGAGKTTTVDILSGQRGRDAGSAAVLGRDPAAAGLGRAGRIWRARIGVVAQSAGTVPELTVSELVSHVASFYPAPRDQAEVIALTGLDGSAAKRIGTLSGGQARRLDVALAVVGRPGLLFLDEPTTGFDPEARRQFWDLIRQLSDEGTTRRLAATPMPRAAYFAGKVIQVLVCAVAETALLLAVGVLFYHVSLPSQPGRWLTFGWVFLLGTAACAVAGIAVSSLPKKAAGAAPLITLPLTMLSFVSGVYVVPLSTVPAPLRDVASVFPLRWLAQGLRSVFLPDSAARLEPAGSWQHGLVALVLLAWIAGGLVICTRTFRWRPRS
jgi:ABC-2 type transport system ATP-binding protein